MKYAPGAARARKSVREAARRTLRASLYAIRGTLFRCLISQCRAIWRRDYISLILLPPGLLPRRLRWHILRATHAMPLSFITRYYFVLISRDSDAIAAC